MKVTKPDRHFVLSIFAMGRENLHRLLGKSWQQFVDCTSRWKILDGKEADIARSAGYYFRSYS